MTLLEVPMTEQKEFKVFQNQVEQYAETDADIRTLLNDLCESLIKEKLEEDGKRVKFSLPDGYGLLELFAILFLYHVAQDIWAYGRAWMALSLAEKQARIIKSLMDKGMDKETATALVMANMKVIEQRGDKDEALAKLITLSGKDDKDK
jgi:hypothetical protein